MARLVVTPRGIALGSLLVLLAALGASAEEIILQPRRSPGDSYELSLSAATSSELLSRGDRDRSRQEDVELRYRATVVVLETDARGIPIRERHQGVSLTFQRAGESGSLFGEGTSFEVRRVQPGDVQIFIQGRRAERKIEKVVARVLASQLEYGIGALVEPGRAVQVGETWELDRARVKRFLRAEGIRRFELGAPPTATLSTQSGEGEGSLVVRYEIPVASFELAVMPPNTHVARSEGSLRGEIRLGSDAARSPVQHASTFDLSLHGAVDKYGVVRPSAWSYRRSESLDQLTQPAKPELASR